MAKLSFSMVECQKTQTSVKRHRHNPSCLQHSSNTPSGKQFHHLLDSLLFQSSSLKSMKHNHDDLKDNFWLWRRTNQNENNKIAMHMPPALHFPTPCCLVSLTSCMTFQWRLQLFVTKPCCPFATTWWGGMLINQTHQPNSSGTSERIPKVKTLSNSTCKVAAIPQLQTDD
jgi:hypothetical protein